MSHLLTSSIKKLGAFSEADIELFYSKLEQKEIQKDEFVLKEGEMCSDICFIIEGNFRQYRAKEDGTEVTFQLYLENDWMLDHQSFTGRKPSLYNIQALENGKFYKLNIEQAHDLIQASPAFFALGRILESTGQQPYFELGYSAEQKYRHLLENKPQIIQRFPLKYIASYLNLTPETLSRVRAKIGTIN